MPESERDDRPHLVIVGAGFGGLELVKRLTGRRAPEHDYRITWVDRRNHHTFQPLLYQVATAGLQPQDIGVPVRALARRRPAVRVRVGEVVDIDTAARSIAFADGGSLTYDRLVLAAGAVTTDFGIPGVEEHGLPLKSLRDATAMRDHLLRCFERVSARPVQHDDGTLTFVIAGGGPTGVEVAGALAELIDLVLRRDHPELDLDRVRIVLVELQEQLLPTMGAFSGRAARKELTRRGVEVRLGVGVSAVHADRVEFDDGTVLPARTLIWSAGIAASPLARTLGVEPGRGGRVGVDAHLRVRGIEGVYAIGDIAGTIGDGDALPQVAPVAIQQARHVARHLTAPIGVAGFRYLDKGTMATIGRRAAVAELPFGLRLRGAPAWLAWLVLHVLLLAGFKNRVGVLFSWVWNYVFRDHAARLIIQVAERSPATPPGEDERERIQVDD
ncbi:MAG: NAD(P)/FAD-dependent oxidoreductase [Nitriliruptoraceae bacterium]|nr:NAD(P)/FAD-dependent oxidoreductase [Nitriliruptoraceae bacterium]